MTTPTTAGSPAGRASPPALAGKRILVTGATGFLGTALVERLAALGPGLRGRRPGAAHPPVGRGRRAWPARSSATTASTACAPSWGERFDDEVATRLVAVAGDVGRDGLGLDDEGRRAARLVRRGRALRRHRRLRRPPRHRRRGEPARPVARGRGHRGGRRGPAGATTPSAAPTHLVTVSTAYVAGTHQGDATETLATEAMASGARARTHTTVTTEVDIDAEVDRGPAPARRPRVRVAPSRALGAVHQGGPGRARRGRAPTCWPSGPRSCATSGSATQLVERGPGPGPGPGLARRLRLHQGAG